MANIDLTLNNLMIPALPNYSPGFGTKKPSGGLSTEECMVDMLAGFSRQRPVTITENSQTTSGTTVQYNATILMNAANKLFQIGAGAYAGCRVTVVFAYAGSFKYTGKTGTVTDSLRAGAVVEYMWLGSYWKSVSAPVDIDDVYTQLPDVPNPGTVYGGQWEEHPYAGMFFRSQGGNAKTFTTPIAGSFTAETVFTATNDLPSSVVVGDLVISGTQYRTITAISGKNITVDSAFSNRSNITNLLIGQADAFQNHGHELDGSGSKACASGTSYGIWAPNESGTIIKMGNPSPKSGYGAPRYSTETRSQNLTVKHWLRLA